MNKGKKRTDKIGNAKEHEGFKRILSDQDNKGVDDVKLSESSASADGN